MSYATHAASAPAGQYDIVLLELSHPTWATKLRFADAIEDVTVTLPDASVVTFTATGADMEGAPTDDTGVDSRNIAIPDMDLILLKRVEALHYAGEIEPITATIYIYLSTDLTVPVSVASLRVANPKSDGRRVTFEVSTVNVVNRDAPGFRFTFANSPGLRR